MDLSYVKLQLKVFRVLFKLSFSLSKNVLFCLFTFTECSVDGVVDVSGFELVVVDTPDDDSLTSACSRCVWGVPLFEMT